MTIEKRKNQLITKQLSKGEVSVNPSVSMIDSRRIRVTLLLFLVMRSALEVSGHPQCLDYLPPYVDIQDLSFCTQYTDVGCCTKDIDEHLKRQYDEILSNTGTLSEICLQYVHTILCQECSPFSSHIYALETTNSKTPLPGLCTDYCLDFYNECQHVIEYMVQESTILSAAQSSATGLCNLVAAIDVGYCYPDVLANNELGEQLTEAVENREGCLCVEEVASTLVMPIIATHAGDGSHRFFVGEQRGIVYIYDKNGTKYDEPFLDMSSYLHYSSGRAQGDERGLGGLAFHPQFKENGRVFVSYVTSNTSQKVDVGVFVTERRLAQGNKNKIDPDFERLLLHIPENSTMHNDGQLIFGPQDGYLYIFLGDGGKFKGSLGDPWGPKGNGQNPKSFPGSVIRIDVDHEEGGKPYAIPTDNPFVNKSTGLPEIFAYGFRSLWRSSIDRGDRHTSYGKGRIFSGDVGHRRYEEIDLVLKGGNYGWKGKEGYSCYDVDMCNDDLDDIEPLHVYDHSVGKAVIGGYVYRGCQSPNLAGQYFFGDYDRGKLFKLVENVENGTWDHHSICMGDNNICNNGLTGIYPRYLLSFGEDEAGEIYILTTARSYLNSNRGAVLKLVDPLRRGTPEECQDDETTTAENAPTQVVLSSGMTGLTKVTITAIVTIVSTVVLLF
ncbi:HHIP-like protein 2 isoform X1 [Glandiceps talaboti]